MAGWKCVKTSKTTAADIASTIQTKLGTLSIKSGNIPQVNIIQLSGDTCIAVISYEEA